MNGPNGIVFFIMPIALISFFATLNVKELLNADKYYLESLAPKEREREILRRETQRIENEKRRKEEQKEEEKMKKLAHMIGNQITAQTPKKSWHDKYEEDKKHKEIIDAIYRNK